MQREVSLTKALVAQLVDRAREDIAAGCHVLAREKLLAAEHSDPDNGLIRDLLRSLSVASRRVLLVCDYFWPWVGGVESFMEDLGVNLKRAGVEVEIAVRHLSERQSLEHRGIPIHEVRTEDLPETDASREEFHRFRSRVTSGRYDAVIELAPPQYWIGVGLYNLPKPRPRIISLPIINLAMFPQWQRNNDFQMVKDVLADADVLVSITENGPGAQLFRDFGLTHHFLPHAVERNAARENFRETHGFSKDLPLFVVVANFVEVKNQPALIRLMRELPGVWQLALIGNPHPNAVCHYDSILAEAAADPRVRVVGGLPREEAAAAIRDADMLLLPSLAEGCPLVVLQAMSYGTPWVATPECGSVHDEAGGIVTPLDDFPRTIENLLKLEAERRALGALGKRHFDRCFSWETSLPIFVELIETGSTSADLRMPQQLRLENQRIVDSLTLFR